MDCVFCESPVYYGTMLFGKTVCHTCYLDLQAHFKYEWAERERREYEEKFGVKLREVKH